MRAALAFCALLPATQALAQPNWMLGNWYGYGQPQDKSSMWLERVAPGGKLHIQHRTCVQGKAVDELQEGSWSLKGDILTVRIERIDGQALSGVRDDIYRIQSHTATRQTYRLERTGFVYNSRKVDGKFQLPPCDLSS
jgi:hypothetical protein